MITQTNIAKRSHHKKLRSSSPSVFLTVTREDSFLACSDTPDQKELFLVVLLLFVVIFNQLQAGHLK